MPGFSVHNGVFTCEDVVLSRIAEREGTPTHVYSGGLIDARYHALDQAFAGHPHRIHYAVKANSTLGIVRRLAALGAGADANSGGELEVALRAGLAPSDIVFTGVGKTPDELARAIGVGVRAINAESAGEVERIDALAGRLGTRARIAVRVNPDVDAGSHPHISTGHRATKFGMSVPEARALAVAAARRAHVDVVGLHVHVGSQLTGADPVRQAFATIASLAADLRAAGLTLQHLDVGGGLGIPYREGQPTLSVDDYAAAILPLAKDTGLELLLEPGRWIVGPAGVLLARVVDLKPNPGGDGFVVIDAGMTDLIRPALYGAWHHIAPVAPRSGPLQHVDIVGPVCETTDTLGAGREMPPVEVGDLVVIRDTGAYGSVMASNYNRRPTAAEVLVDDGQWTRIRRRQTIADMLQWDE